MVRADLRVLPFGKSKEEIIKLVDKAIARIKESGIEYEVTPTCTVMKGELKQILDLVREIHEDLMKEDIPLLVWELRAGEFKS